MKAIVAVDLNWGIGYKGNLLQRIPDDMRKFKQMTTGKVVVMGQETFDSLPGKEPLKDRVNIVLSNDPNFNGENIIICRSLKELFAELEQYPSDEVFVIGGESVYTQLLDYCNEIYVTKIHNKYTADKHYPNLDLMPAWQLTSTSETYKYNDISYYFVKYIKENKPDNS